MLVQLKCSRDN